LQRYSQQEKDRIIECLNIVDELIGGKFILFDTKASKLLKVIASSEFLYGLFAKCLVDYDFAHALRLGEEYKKAQGTFKLAEDNDQVLAFVFCLILEVNNKKLSLNNFVTNNFFSPNGYNYSYLNFSRSILQPFKIVLMQELGIEEMVAEMNFKEKQMEMDDVVKDNIREEESEIKILFANLLFALNELHAKVVEDKKIKQNIKDEEYIIVVGLIEAVKLENLKVLNALIIPLEYVLGKQKSVKSEYQAVKDCMLEIYTKFKK